MVLCKYMRLLVVAAVGGFFTFSLNLASAQPVIKIGPADSQPKVGDEFVLSAVISNVEGLFGASFEIHYDANALDYVSASAGNFMGEDAIFFDMKGSNSVSIAVSMKAGASPASGSGTIATITFRAKTEGTSRISYRQETLNLQRADGTLILAKVEDETVTVVGEATSGPILSINPAAKDASIGEQFPIKVEVENVIGLFAASFELRFDETILRAASAVPESFLGDDVIHMTMPDNGRISIGISRKAGSGGVDGSGTLALVTLETIGDGDTDILFNSETITLKGPDGTPVGGFDSLNLSTAHISVRRPSLVPKGKQIRTWGYVKDLP